MSFDRLYRYLPLRANLEMVKGRLIADNLFLPHQTAQMVATRLLIKSPPFEIQKRLDISVIPVIQYNCEGARA